MFGLTGTHLYRHLYRHVVVLHSLQLEDGKSGFPSYWWQWDHVAIEHSPQNNTSKCFGSGQDGRRGRLMDPIVLIEMREDTFSVNIRHSDGIWGRDCGDWGCYTLAPQWLGSVRAPLNHPGYHSHLLAPPPASTPERMSNSNFQIWNASRQKQNNSHADMQRRLKAHGWKNLFQQCAHECCSGIVTFVCLKILPEKEGNSSKDVCPDCPAILNPWPFFKCFSMIQNFDEGKNFFARGSFSEDDPTLWWVSHPVRIQFWRVSFYTLQPRLIIWASIKCNKDKERALYIWEQIEAVISLKFLSSGK